MSTPATIVQRFATFGAGLATARLDDDVVHHAKRAIVDWYAALVAGAVAPPATLLEAALADDLDRGRARLASGRQATARTAALINGTAAHTAEVDDIYRSAIYHPGAPTIAAALAIGQDRGASGLDLIRGVVAGYEISTRIGAALGRQHYRYWHNTGTVGTFGAAAATASLLKLDAAGFAHALSTCATFAAGLQQAFRMDSMSKPLHAGHAADAGVLAGLAAGRGVTGSLDVLDGEAGLGRAMSGDPDWDQAAATLGAVFNITDMTFKNHACCGHAFAAIDGALALQQQMSLPWMALERIIIGTYEPALAVAGNPDPVTAAEARFSIPFVIATALIHGRVRLAAFADDRLRARDIRALMKRVELQVDPEADRHFPHRRSARITFQTRDGREGSWLQPTRKGDPDAPLSDDDLNEKFRELVEPVLGRARAQQVLSALWSLDGLRDLSAF